MASYLDGLQWRMHDAEINKFQTTHTGKLHPHYNSTGYHGAQFPPGNMTKRIWHHKDLQLMMVQFVCQ